MNLEKIQQEFTILKQKGGQDVSLKHYLDRIDIILWNNWTSDRDKAVQIWEVLYNMKHNVSIRNSVTGENTPIWDAFLKTQSAVQALIHTNVPLQIAS